MNYNISKELFEEVRGFKVKSITTGSFIFFEMEDGYSPNYGIPTDTFFFHCKEWAKTQGYVIWSYLDQANIFNFDGIKINSFISKEQQAVFDACQWILDNKAKQSKG